MTPSKILLFLLLSFIGGVFIASFFPIPRLIIWEFFILGAFLGLVFLENKAIVVFGICLFVFGLALLRTENVKYEFLADNPANNHSQSTRESGKEESGFLFLENGFKRKIETVINENLPAPQGDILFSLLFGEQQKISKIWKEKLNRAGVRHITAVSGSNIVIVSSVLILLAIALGLYRGSAFYFALFFIWFYVLVIGFPASAVRAGIMGSLFLFCEKIGRQKTADRALILAAGAMLAFNPLLLRYDIGFQLSFLAVLGIIYLMPFFQNTLEKITFLKGIGLAEIVAMTLAAQVFTLPLLLYNFGYVSLVSLFSNILIVPLLSFVMVAGFSFLIAAMIFQSLGFIFLFPLTIMLNYFVWVVEFFAEVPWAVLRWQISWLWIPVFYLILGIFSYLQTKRKSEIMNCQS